MGRPEALHRHDDEVVAGGPHGPDEVGEQCLRAPDLAGFEEKKVHADAHGERTILLRMRIAYDAAPLLNPRTGVGHYAAALLDALLAADPELEVSLFAV